MIDQMRGVFSCVAVVFPLWRRRTTCKLICALFSVMILQSCWSTYESKKREECAPAFENNFGFSPPASITELKLKYFGFRDGQAQWMTFTYDSEVFARIIADDALLREVNVGTPGHDEIISEFLRESPNRPTWFSPPGANTKVFYVKKDHLRNTFSEYYLWVDHKSKMVYFHEHYFD